MCWSSGFKKLSECKRIARKDVHVRKFVNGSKSPNKVMSYFTGFVYKLGKTYYDDYISTLDWCNNSFGVCIFVGFNSYSTECKITRSQETTSNGEKKYTIDVYSPDGAEILENYEPDGLLMLECVIPKGSTYYVNEYAEIVSERIKPIRIMDLDTTNNNEQPQ